MNEFLWYTSRATGIVAVILMTGIVILGLLVKTGSSNHATSTMVMGIHRNLSIGMSAFIVLHVVTAIAETYVDIGWISAIIPFTSGFSPKLIGIGALAFDAFLAVLITSIMRDRIDEARWRQIHWLSYALWGFAIIHGVGLGTSDEPLLRGTTILCAIVGAGAIYRYGGRRDDHDDERRRIAAQEWS